ncbi:Lin0512 family protein [Roseovarius pacificus]|uniref:Lin0512 family protein n=1 Tax=Roseovarius pacificus TaxID=337701 RepID=UPI0029677F6A|nr:Lin0512 family protein [Roseovarius pacificus]MDW3117650.1 Lin0512 family protein [Roseovarius pacificus]
MSERRVIIEMGMGNDLHGMDYQKAAARAIEDAIRHSTLPIFESTGLDHANMRVQVTVGVQAPDKLNTRELANGLPRGIATVSAVKGGQDVTNPETGETLVIATAAVEAFLPDQTGVWRLSKA